MPRSRAIARRLSAAAPSVARCLRPAARISLVISARARSRAVLGTDLAEPPSRSPALAAGRAPAAPLLLGIPASCHKTRAGATIQSSALDRWVRTVHAECKREHCSRLRASDAMELHMNSDQPAAATAATADSAEPRELHVVVGAGPIGSAIARILAAG